MPDRPLRVLFVGGILPHYRYRVYKALELSGEVEISFAAGRNGKEGNIPTIPTSMLRRAYLLRNLWLGKALIQIGLFRILLRERPQAVIFEGNASYLSTWVWAAVLRALGVRIYFWTIGWHRPESGFKRVVRLAFYLLGHQLLLYGEKGQKFGIAAGYPASRMRVIRNSWGSYLDDRPIAQEDLAAFQGSLPERIPGRMLFGAVIRLSPSKGLEQIVEAVGLLCERGVQAGVLIVGEGPERNQLIKLARETDVPVFLPGAAYTKEQLRSAYALIDVSVIPSAAGLSVLQSFSFGTPVLTHNDWSRQMPEAEAIEPGVTGEFFPAGDAESLAVAMQRWGNRTQRDAVAVASACLAVVDGEWSPSEHARRILAALRDEGTSQVADTGT